MSKIQGFNLFLSNALKYGFAPLGPSKTGQTISYVNFDDGDYEKGWPKTGDRFTDNGDGTVTDRGTGLMWVENPTAAGVVGTYNWFNAILACENLNYAGHTDWRLPNILELYSICNFAAYNPAKYSLFTILSQRYWSSTTSFSSTGQAAYISFLNATGNYTAKNLGYYLVPVRFGN
jgi:hypothetical protein